MSDIDRYPTLGPKLRIGCFEDALSMVRNVHPDAVKHGSIGIERVWTVGEMPDRKVVAHHWSPSGGAQGKPWWIRICPEIDQCPWFDLP